jgi:hypothetical protein
MSIHSRYTGIPRGSLLCGGGFRLAGKSFDGLRCVVHGTGAVGRMEGWRHR